MKILNCVVQFMFNAGENPIDSMGLASEFTLHRTAASVGNTHCSWSMKTWRQHITLTMYAQWSMMTVPSWFHRPKSGSVCFCSIYSCFPVQSYFNSRVKAGLVNRTFDLQRRINTICPANLTGFFKILRLALSRLKAECTKVLLA